MVKTFTINSKGMLYLFIGKNRKKGNFLSLYHLMHLLVPSDPASHSKQNTKLCFENSV